jgi:hypothetical protein
MQSGIQSTPIMLGENAVSLCLIVTFTRNRRSAESDYTLFGDIIREELINRQSLRQRIVPSSRVGAGIDQWLSAVGANARDARMRSGGLERFRLSR